MEINILVRPLMLPRVPAVDHEMPRRGMQNFGSLATEKFVIFCLFVFNRIFEILLILIIPEISLITTKSPEFHLIMAFENQQQQENIDQTK